MNSVQVKFRNFIGTSALLLFLPACTFIKNYSKPTSEEPTSSTEPAEDFRCKGALTEYWSDPIDTKITHTLCRANLGLIDAASVESANKQSPTQAVLVFMGNISKSKKEANDETFMDACETNRGESLFMVRMSEGRKKEVVFCKFSDGSILEGRTLFFGSMAPGYGELSGLLL